MYSPPTKPTAPTPPTDKPAGVITGNSALDALLGKPAGVMSAVPTSAGSPPPLPKATATPKAGDPWSTEALVSAVQDGESAEEYTW
jgi:hypothetical protein